MTQSRQQSHSDLAYTYERIREGENPWAAISQSFSPAQSFPMHHIPATTYLESFASKEAEALNCIGRADIVDKRQQ